MNRRQLRQRPDRAWLGFEESYAGLADDRLLETGVRGEWSVRDIIAHVTKWEEEVLTHIPILMAGGRPPQYSVRYGGINAFNVVMTERTRGLSILQVRARQERTHGKIAEFIDSVPKSQFKEETRFRRRLRWDNYGHYPKHAAAIWAWRELRSTR